MKSAIKRYTSILLIVAMLCVMFIPQGTVIAEDTLQSKVQFVDPPMFNPDAGETVKMKWNFEIEHNASVKVYKGQELIKVIKKTQFYAGNYTILEETWDGKNANGQAVTNGVYTIVVQPLEEEWAMYPASASVMVNNSAAADIAIAPNLYGNNFMVYGKAEENTSKVEVFINGVLSKTYTADQKLPSWSVYVSLPIYEKVKITAKKTNLIPKLNEKGEVIGEEKEVTDLGPIHVLLHLVRPYDRLTNIAEFYYGVSSRYSEIVSANNLVNLTQVKVGTTLLVFNPTIDIIPQESKIFDPKDYANGIVDLNTGATSKDPVNLATGNFLYNHQDIKVNGRYPLSFSRFYNSTDFYNGDIGRNWHHSYEIRLLDQEDKKVDIIFGDGHRETFIATGSGKYTSMPGKFNSLVKNIDFTYTLTQPDKQKYNFNDIGQLTSIVDTNGNTIKLVYEDLLLREVRSDSGYLLIQYYVDGKIRQVSDALGRYVEYTYTGNFLTNYRDVEGYRTEYRYDTKGRLTHIIDPLKVESIINVYDDKDRVTKQTLPDDSKMYYAYDDVNQTVTLTERNGNKITYKYDKDFKITDRIEADGATVTGINDSQKRDSYTDKKGNTYHYKYDDRGNITGIQDPLGNWTNYTYDVNNRITSVKNPDEKTYSFTYDEKGNLLTSTDPLNRATVFENNAKGLPEKIRQPDDGIIKIDYDTRGNVKEMTDPLENTTKYEYDAINRIKAVIQPEGNRTEYEYTDSGNVKKITDAEANSIYYTYNEKGKPIEVKDQNGNVTKYKYNGANQVVEVVDALNGTTSYEYDPMWNVSKVTDPNGGITSYKYNALNRLESVTDPENFTSYYEYDLNGNITKAKDPKGNATQYQFDQLNRLVAVTDANQAASSFEYDAVGRIKKAIDALSNSTEYEYDAAGQLVKTKDALDNATSFAYNALGLIDTVTDAKGAVTKYEYNKVGLLLKMTDPEGAQTCWEYDRNGNVIKVIDAMGQATIYSYDGLNRMKTITNALGNSRSFQYTKLGKVASVTDENKNTTEYKYDALGRLTEVVDAEGHSTKYIYDKVGNLTELHQYRSMDVADTAGYTKMSGQTVTQSVYGPAQQSVVQGVYGQSVTQTVYASNEPYNVFQPTFYQYDKRGLLKETKDAAGMVTVYNYDGNGNLISVNDRDGYTTAYQYDPTNLLKKITYGDGKQVEFGYNPLGQLTQMKDWLGTTNLELDPLGRVLKVTDFDNRVVQYTWGATGEKESIVYPDGSRVSYAYDKNGSLTGVTDAQNKKTAYKYNPLGALIERILPNGSKTKYDYDPTAKLKQLTEFSPSGKMTDIYTYSYDPAGNRIKTDKNRTDLDEEAVAGEEHGETAYRYNALNQLSEVMKSNGEGRKYFYDTVGNRVRLEEYGGGSQTEAINYQYDQLNRLVKTFEDSYTQEDNNRQYFYDSRGNLIQTRSGGKIFNEYSFDAANRLVEVVNKHNDSTSYVYDGFGNRVAAYIDLDTNAGGNRPDKGNGNGNGNGKGKGHAYGHDKDKAKGKAIGHGKDQGENQRPGWGHQYKRDSMEMKFVLDITKPYDNVLMIYGDNYQVQRYTQGLDMISVDMWELENPNNGWIPDSTGTNLSGTPDRLYYLHDELGSPTKVIGENGKTSAHYNYDEFGRPLSFKKFDQNWPGPDNTFGYTGYQYDVSSELWYAQARYYMPEVGRFISEDSYKGRVAEPLSLNLYTYCINDPVKYIDPSGLDPVGLRSFIESRNGTVIWNDGFGIATATLNGKKVSFGTFDKRFWIQDGRLWCDDTVLYGAFGIDRPTKWGVPIPGVVFNKDKTQGIWYSTVDAIQRKGGYNDFYDNVFDRLCDMDLFISEFEAGDIGWRIEGWRGNYLNMGVGAEIGIYYKSKNAPVDHYAAVDNNNMLNMQFTLFHNDPSNHDQILSRERTKHWWLNGFRPGIGEIPAKELVMVGSITFNSKDMADAFIKGLTKVNGTFDISQDGATVNFIWK